MSGETIDVKTQEGIADAYLSKPPDDGKRHRGVLLLIDAFGLRPTIEAIADRIAAQGFVVLAPNVFYREGRAPVMPMPDMSDPEQRAPFMERIRPMMQVLTPERVARDGAAYLDMLEEVGHGPVGITGYCLGGRLGWTISTTYPDRVAALGCFHTGGLVTEGEDSLHRSAGLLSADVFLGFADNDPSATPEQIEMLEQALEAAGVRYRAEVFEGAGHGYTMQDTPVYDEAATERHFQELFALLQRSVAA